MTLTQQQLDFFSQEGYLSYGPLLKAEEVEVLRREYDEVFRKAVEENSFRNLSQDDGQPAPAKASAPVQMFQIMQVCERNIHFRKLLYDSRILDAVQDLLGPNLMLFHDQALFKPAKHGGPVLWHQDNAYWQCRPANLVSCWLTLDAVVRENGAMQVIPGSHLKPVWHGASSATSALIETPGIDESKAVVVELPAGGCMFHHCQTLHYTAPNTTERTRRAFVIHFMAPGTSNKKGEVLRPGFGHPVLRMCV